LENDDTFTLTGPFLSKERGCRRLSVRSAQAACQRRKGVKVNCPGCHAAFTVPDEKIPDVKGVRILCPKCKVPIDLGQRIESSIHAVQGEMSALGVDGEVADLQEDVMALDVVEEGVKTSLLCSTDQIRAEKIRQTLDELSFFVVQAGRADYALRKLNNNHYDLIVLEERFGSGKPGENLVLHHLQLSPMHLRRQFFLLLFSDTLPTLDGMLAYRIGVNMIMNYKDIEKTKVLLVRAMKDHKMSYGLYMDELTRRGQR